MQKFIHTYACAIVAAFALTACSEAPKFGPWDGFVYVEKSENNFTLLPQGRYNHLDTCIRTMQSRTSKNGYPYYCGYECEKNSEGEMDCEKILGYPELN